MWIFICIRNRAVYLYSRLLIPFGIKLTSSTVDTSIVATPTISSSNERDYNNNEKGGSGK